MLNSSVVIIYFIDFKGYLSGLTLWILFYAAFGFCFNLFLKEARK
ncbi:oxidoreductase [Cronobacter sakazakii]|nr:oxidoreductase [Cronobacter sakazakii]MCI0203354.1 oxidoreductase [Cronobacter sakazakii]MCI0227541.1 oxidoreductase [Cronobacter sakazakii]MCI0278779.1 oxidoreductase [Cronobacter sakazakii]MCI0297245.1 oxidoreductase [Cronobacter sakazakii]